MPMVGKPSCTNSYLLFFFSLGMELDQLRKCSSGERSLLATRDSLGLGGVSVYYRLRISGRGDRASSLSGRVGPLWIGGT